MRIDRVIGGILAAALALIAPPASATSSITYYLDQSNELIDGLFYLQVDITDSGAAFDFEVSAPRFPDGALVPGGKNFGIVAFGFNSSSIPGSFSNEHRPTGWNGDSFRRLDGFGVFDFAIRGPGSPLETLTFRFIPSNPEAPLGTFAKRSSGTAGEGNVYFAAHVIDISTGRFEPDGTPITGAFFGGSTTTLPPIPEPGTYAMLLAGLGMLGFMLRRRVAAR